MRKQVKVLEYQPEVVLDFAELCLRRIDRTLAVLSADCKLIHVRDLAAGEGLQESAAAEQCGFSRTGRTDDRNNFSRLYEKGDIFQNLHVSEMLLQVFNF